MIRRWLLRRGGFRVFLKPLHHRYELDNPLMVETIPRKSISDEDSIEIRDIFSGLQSEISFLKNRAIDTELESTALGSGTIVGREKVRKFFANVSYIHSNQ